jgi:hypothetical protein
LQPATLRILFTGKRSLPRAKAAQPQSKRSDILPILKVDFAEARTVVQSPAINHSRATNPPEIRFHLRHPCVD